MKKTLSIVMLVVLVFVAVACSPESTTHVHEWELTSEIAATCEKDGTQTYTCKICKTTEQRAVAATGHKHSANITGTRVEQVTCAESGLYSFRCTVCGEVFNEAVTPEQAKANKAYANEFKHVYLKDGKYVDYTNNGSDAEYVSYLKDDIVAATMFTAESQVGRCASCGEALPAYSKVVGDTETYAPINGTWVYEALDEDGNATLKAFVDITQKKDKAGTLVTTAYLITSSFDAADGWTTDAAQSVSGPLVSVGTGVRALKFTYSGNDYYISEEAGDVVVKSGTTGAEIAQLESALESESGKKIGSVDFKENHNHIYSETYDANHAKADSIYGDPNFSVMKYFGTPYIKNTNHYVECSECGISRYAVSCKPASTSGTANLTNSTCMSCGYTSASGKYLTISVERNSDPAISRAAEAATAGATKADTDESTGTRKAVDALTDAWNSLTAAKEALTTWGLGNSAEAEMITTLLSDVTFASETVKKSKNKLSVKEALKELSSSTETVGNTDYAKTLLGAATTTEISVPYEDGPSDGTTGTYTVSSVQKALTDAATALTKIISVAATQVDAWKVPTGHCLNVDVNRFTSFSGLSFDFAENTGWVNSSGAVLLKTGFKVVENSSTLTFCCGAK